MDSELKRLPILFPYRPHRSMVSKSVYVYIIYIYIYTGGC